MRDRMMDGDYAAMAAREEAAAVRGELRIAEGQSAKWIAVGTSVDYCSVIGGPPTKRGPCGRRFSHVCDEADGCRWDLVS